MMPRSPDDGDSECGDKDPLARLSPTNLDADVSDVAVGTASPNYDAQSPVDRGVSFLSSATPKTDGVSPTGRTPPQPSNADHLSAGAAAAASSVAQGEPAAGGRGSQQGLVEAPHMLELNTHNLANFESSVQRGAVSLRTDVIDTRRFVGRAADANSSNNNPIGDTAAPRHGLRIARPSQDNTDGGTAAGNGPSRPRPGDASQAEVAESLMTNHAASRSAFGTGAASSIAMEDDGSTAGGVDSPLTTNIAFSQRPAAHHHHNHHSRDRDGSLTMTADRFSAVSDAGSASSPFRCPADPLSQENLILHQRELNSGAPQPLSTENIPSCLPRPATTTQHGTTAATATTGAPRTGVVGVMPISGRDDGDGDELANSGANATAGSGGLVMAPGGSPLTHMAHSMVVEPSEASHSDIASTVDASMLRAAVMSAVHSDGGLEDMWSTATTADAGDAAGGSGGAGGVHGLLPGSGFTSLSKANLRQLRVQLESGETPLRPELLAGLSSVARAMNARSEPSPSMTVEEPADEIGAGRTCGSNRRTGAVRRVSTAASDDDDDEMESAGNSAGFKNSTGRVPGGGDPSLSEGGGGASFHSTFVEVPARGVAGGGSGAWRRQLDPSASAEGIGGGRARAASGRINSSINAANNNLSGMDAGESATALNGSVHLLSRSNSGGVDDGEDDGGDLDDRNVTLDDDEDDDDDEEEADKSTTALSPDDDVDGHHDGSVFMTEDGTNDAGDDIGYLRQCLGDVMSTLKDTRREQLFLSRQLQHIRNDITRSGSGSGGSIPNEAATAGGDNRDSGADAPATTTAAAVRDPPQVQRSLASLRADLNELRLFMREVQRSQTLLLGKIEQLQRHERRRGGGGAGGGSVGSVGSGPVTPVQWPQSLTRGVRLVVRADPSIFGTDDAAAAGSANMTKTTTTTATAARMPSFLLPVSATATVREARVAFLQRLREQNPSVAALGDLAAGNTVMEMDGHALFDTLVLGADLHLDPAGYEGYTVTVRRL